MSRWFESRKVSTSPTHPPPILLERSFKWTLPKPEKKSFAIGSTSTALPRPMFNLNFYALFYPIVVRHPLHHCACSLSWAPDENNIWLLWVNPSAPESCPGQTQRPCCKHHERGYTEPRTRQSQALPGRRGNSYSTHGVQYKDTVTISATTTITN